MSAADQVEALLAEFTKNAALPEIALGLERMEACLAKLGDPQTKLPPVVHIAGTNGKGSTLATLRAIFEADGKRVHAYTSPHLVRFHERIVLAGKEISDEALLAVLLKVKAVAEEIPVTFFEATTLAGFVAFSEAEADVLLLEVGLGGRLDATNVVIPKVSVITPIAEDHKEYLGDTLEMIAGEKAGIIKPGVPVIVAKQAEAVMGVLRHEIADVVAAAWIYGEAWDVVSEKPFKVRVGKEIFELPSPALVGEHQYMNAACAFVAARVMGVDEKAAIRGVGQAKWPGRLQKLTRGPLATLSAGAELWLDGGHNPAAAEVIAEWVRSKPQKTGLLVGMLRRKDAEGFFRAFSGLDIPIGMLSMEADGGFGAEELQNYARQAGCKRTHAFQDGAEGIKWLQMQGAEHLLVCGSLYLAGKLLRNHS